MAQLTDEEIDDIEDAFEVVFKAAAAKTGYLCCASGPICPKCQPPVGASYLLGDYPVYHSSCAWLRLYEDMSQQAERAFGKKKEAMLERKLSELESKIVVENKRNDLVFSTSSSPVVAIENEGVEYDYLIAGRCNKTITTVVDDKQLTIPFVDPNSAKIVNVITGYSKSVIIEGASDIIQSGIPKVVEPNVVFVNDRMPKGLEFAYSQYGAFSPYADFPVEHQDKLWATLAHAMCALSRPFVPFSKKSVRDILGARDWESELGPDVEGVLFDMLMKYYVMHGNLRIALLDTGTRPIRYSSTSTFLGVDAKGIGDNLFGRLLMRVRDTIRQTGSYYPGLRCEWSPMSAAIITSLFAGRNTAPKIGSHLGIERAAVNRFLYLFESYGWLVRDSDKPFWHVV